MKKSHLILLFTILSLNLFSQNNERKTIRIPDIPGYQTLKCDFHMHTVFSDGDVWPTVRFKEAWMEGLDVIAISDHIEYQKYKKDIPLNRNRSNQIGAEEAKQYGLVFVPAAEITRDYPFGHNNCLFVSDVEKLYLEDPFASIEAAKEQGAFIFWNHPGWRQENDIPIWYDEQQKLYDSKSMMGIEIVNGNDYYPLAHQWALEKNLTLIGNSDVHDLIAMNYDLVKSHRPLTLVFAKEKSVAGVREALEQGRTAVYFVDTLIGKKEYLLPIFDNAIEIINAELKMTDGAMWQELFIQNNSDIPFHLKRTGEVNDNIKLWDGLYVPPNKTVKMTVKALEGIEEGKNELSVEYLVENLYIAPQKGLPVNLNFSVEYFNKK